MEIVILIICVVFGVVGMAVGDLNGKGNGPTGFVLGALLGPIGWIIVAVLPPSETAGKESPKKEVPKKESDKERIARLEAELAKLNVAKAAPARKPKRADDDLAGDGEVPTFKLD